MTSLSDPKELPTDDPKLTVYFDGSCPVCTVEISHYRKLDKNGQIRFEDASKSDAQLGCDLSQEQAMARFHIRRADGKLLSGAAGFTEIWKILPGWRYLGFITRIPGAVGLLEILYRGFLPIRPALVRLLGPVLKSKADSKS